MIDFTIAAAEVGYVAAAAAIAQGARFVVGRVVRARTASAIRKMLRESEPIESGPSVAGYRDNATHAAEVEGRAPGLAERWRAKRAAAYVHDLEHRAKLDP
jgi:hypothetical protein